MPVQKCSRGKYRIGSGQCMYRSRESAERAYKGYLGSKYAESHAPQSAMLEGAILADQYHTAKRTENKKNI
jgi:hypothetical protein